MLESGSWGHSVLQTPALVFFLFWLFIFVLLLFGPILKYRKTNQPKAHMSL